MKLLFCQACNDVVRLRLHERYCRCGLCGGQYIDELNAVYWGAPAIPLGFANGSFVQALEKQPEGPGPGGHFLAFVIPKVCETMLKIDRMIKIRKPGDHKDVHTEHCCVLHGCKYDDDFCLVATGERRQSGPCEECGQTLEGEYGEEARRDMISRWPNDPRVKEKQS